VQNLKSIGVEELEPQAKNVSVIFEISDFVQFRALLLTYRLYFWNN